MHLISSLENLFYKNHQHELEEMNDITVMILSFRTDRSWQTVQTQIRLLQEEQSDQGLHCLLLYLHHFDKIP